MESVVPVLLVLSITYPTSSGKDFSVFVTEVVPLFSSPLTFPMSSVKELGGFVVVVSAVLLSGLLKPSSDRWAKNKIAHRWPLP